jgi:hypothetical protein
LSDPYPNLITPPVLGLRSMAGQWSLSVLGPVGSSYQVETKSSLSQTNWTAYQSILLTNSPGYLALPKSADPMRFWRARLQ